MTPICTAQLGCRAVGAQHTLDCPRMTGQTRNKKKPTEKPPPSVPAMRQGQPQDREVVAR